MKLAGKINKNSWYSEIKTLFVVVGRKFIY